MGWHYRRNYEFVLVGQQQGTCKWFGGNAVANVVQINKIIPGARNHPTEKPTALPEFFIKLHSEAGDLVLDPFAGHGSSLVAAKKLRRHYLGFELSTEYCERSRKSLDIAEAEAPLFQKEKIEQPRMDFSV